MEYVGSSAIEDLLQQDVPETIQLCLEAQIRLWVLTGDKQETAIEIGKSCNLINEQEMKLYILSVTDSDGNADQRLFKEKLHEAIMDKCDKPKKSIVIDGASLACALKDSATQEKFYHFGCSASSVICCRVSPK